MIELPKNLEEIGDHAFAGCIGLTGELVIHSKLDKIGKAAFAGCYNISKARQVEPLDDPPDVMAD